MCKQVFLLFSEFCLLLNGGSQKMSNCHQTMLYYILNQGFILFISIIQKKLKEKSSVFSKRPSRFNLKQEKQLLVILIIAYWVPHAGNLHRASIQRLHLCLQGSDCGWCTHQLWFPVKWERTICFTDCREGIINKGIEEPWKNQWSMYLLHVFLYKPRHLWATLETTKCCSLPDTTGHQLKWTCRYLLTRCSDTHNNWCSPALGNFNHKCQTLECNYKAWEKMEMPILAHFTLWQHSKADLMTETFPMHSKL